MGKCLAGVSAVIMSSFWKAHQPRAWRLCPHAERGSPGTWTLWLYSQPQSSSITGNCITVSYMFIYPSRILFSLLSKLIWSKFLFALIQWHCLGLQALHVLCRKNTIFHQILAPLTCSCWMRCLMIQMSRLVPVLLKSDRNTYQRGWIFCSKNATSRLRLDSAWSFNRTLRELIRYVKIVNSKGVTCGWRKHIQHWFLWGIPLNTVGINLWNNSGIWHPGSCSLRGFSRPTRQGRWSEGFMWRGSEMKA